MIDGVATGDNGITAGRGRTKALELGIVASGKGFQRRTQRTDIRDTNRRLTWQTVAADPHTDTAPARLLGAL
ncbi:hypothetical protein ABH922_005340 [Rhodococcus sp. 27YEA15]|uniref:hypothetical protein n=1 Tax=Rhodococcus sp. 27YEA15 TaxID=3156259 RepID=UPI003C7B01F7